MNEWSDGRVIKIPVQDFFFNMKRVQWKGKTITVEYDMFQMLIISWCEKEGWTREQALDEFFGMICDDI